MGDWLDFLDKLQETQINLYGTPTKEKLKPNQPYYFLQAKLFVFFRPFTVNPEVSTLAIQESQQVTVEFNPQKVGDHKGEILIHYDTGNPFLFH